MSSGLWSCFVMWWTVPKRGFLDAAKYRSCKQNKHREKRWFEKGGGVPLWLKQLQTGNDFELVCVCVLFRACICYTAWQTGNNQLLVCLCGFPSYWSTQRGLSILHRYETSWATCQMVYVSVVCRFLRISSTFARTADAYSCSTQSYESRHLLYQEQ